MVTRWKRTYRLWLMVRLYERMGAKKAPSSSGLAPLILNTDNFYFCGIIYPA